MSIIAANGVEVTDEMLESWFDALDNDQWPEAWRNVGEVVEGQPPAPSPDVDPVTIEPVTIYMPQSVKDAIERKASSSGVSTSVYICGVLLGALTAEG